MDNTERKITKIAREANRFTVQTMKEDGIGTAEMDVIHFVRHNPGTTQKEMWETLKIDKGAAGGKGLPHPRAESSGRQKSAALPH